MIAAMAKRHSKELGSVFQRLEELLLAGSGEDEFEETFTLLIAKLWDERSGGGRFRARGDGKKTLAAVKELLREAEAAWPGALEPGQVPRLRPEHLEVCVEALQPHALLGASLDVLDGFFEALVARASKGAKGQFFTPRHVVELCARVVRPRAGEAVLDPACGSGGFLLHARERARLEDGASPALWGFDVDARALRVARALLALAGEEGARLVRLNALLREGETIESIAGRRFDVILTNPPFAGDVRERATLDAYDLGRGRERCERDALFLERCVDLLEPGGRLAIVLPHNKVGAEAHAPLREWLLDRCRVVAVVGLGRNTFLPHTHQKAAVLFARKRRAGETARGEEVLFALSEKDGKDSKGRPRVRAGARAGASPWERLDHDLEEVAAAIAWEDA
jgi:type I restriction enzyme M protein